MVATVVTVMVMVAAALDDRDDADMRPTSKRRAGSCGPVEWCSRRGTGERGHGREDTGR